MERPYTYTAGLFSDVLNVHGSGANIEKFTLAVVVGIILLVLGKTAAKKISSEQAMQAAIVPKSVGVFSVFDFIFEKFISFQDSVLGKENRRHLALTGSIFCFIFITNLLGLIPGMPAITTSVWINLGIAFTVFIAFNYYGVKSSGLGGYLGHFCGGKEILLDWKLWALGGLIFCAEIISTCLRVLTLNLRLYWNIEADHVVIDSFMKLCPYAVPALFYIMGAFVAFMQAFVFTVLTMVYILLATAHEEEH